MLAQWSARGAGSSPATARVTAGPLLLDVLRHAPHRSFGGVEIAGRIDGDPFAHGALGSVGLVRRHEARHLAVLQAADANTPQPARMDLRRGFGIGRID